MLKSYLVEYKCTGTAIVYAHDEDEAQEKFMDTPKYYLSVDDVEIMSVEENEE